MSGRERTLRHLVDNDEYQDVGQGQTQMECLRKEHPLKGGVFAGTPTT